MDEMSRIQETATSLDQEEAEWYSSLLMASRMVKNGDFSFDWTTVWNKIDHQRIYMSMFLRHIPNTQPENIIDLSSREMQEFHGQMNLLKTEVERGKKNSYTDVILVTNRKRMEKVHAIRSEERRVGKQGRGGRRW